MKILRNSLFGAAALMAMGAASARADVLTLGGGWSTFNFFDSGTDLLDGDFDPVAYTFTFASPEFLKITDAFYTGDQFDLIINGVDQGVTSAPSFDTVYVDNFDIAFGNPSFSHAAYYLPAGVYTVTGTVYYSPYGVGAGGIEVATNTPEPGAWSLMLTGFAGLGVVARGRRSRGKAPARA